MLELEYKKGYINVTRDKLLEDLRSVQSEERFKHSLRVEETAIKLAELHYPNLSLEAVSIAALMHDYAKELSLEEQLKEAQEFWPERAYLLSGASSAIWHGYASANILQKKYECTEEDIIKAVASHTIGWYVMEPIVQIVYVADYIEPNRTFDGVVKARVLAEKNLEDAVFYKMKNTIINTVSKERYVFPMAIDIYNNWQEHKKESIWK